MKPFQQSLSFARPSKIGLATGYQAAEWLDCLLCIRVCCQTCLSPNGDPLPEHWQKRIDAIPKGNESLAKILATLNLWRKWTYPHQELTAQAVQGFLWAITEK